MRDIETQTVKTSSPASRALTEVADAVGLGEGRRGVEDVLRAISSLEPAPTRAVSRQTGIPVPIVTAVSNELRARGLLSRGRPAGLTEMGRALVRELGTAYAMDSRCPACGGLGLVVADGIRAAGDALQAVLRGAPAADPRLDQSHCDLETKLRRVLYLHQSGALDKKSVLLLGDDDFMSLAIPLVIREGGLADSIERLVVVDVDPNVIEFARRRLAEINAEAELLVHDLRQPLPDHLRGAFDTVLTDPPYTLPGARLFLSRAASSLREGGGRQVFFCFGPRAPEEILRSQAVMLEMGLAVHSLTRNFNEYLGAGVLGGTSHLYHLVSTPGTAPAVAGEHAGPLYTADLREPGRLYVCRLCGQRLRVGPKGRWATVQDLRRRGCPTCSGSSFRPAQRAPEPLRRPPP